jgi:hypothetical protein
MTLVSEKKIPTLRIIASHNLGRYKNKSGLFWFLTSDELFAKAEFYQSVVHHLLVLDCIGTYV